MRWAVPRRWTSTRNVERIGHLTRKPRLLEVMQNALYLGNARYTMYVSLNIMLYVHSCVVSYAADST